MSKIDEILKETPDTKACRLGPGVTEQVAELFRELFPDAKRALVVDDVNTKRVAGDRVVSLLKSAGIDVAEYTVNPDGSWFHATYDKVEEVREAIRSFNRTVEQSNNRTIPVAVGSGTVNDLVKRASEETGVRYLVVGTAASMDGYTSYGASITKDGMKQTLPCRAPLGALVDSQISAEAPKAMTASGYADLLAKVPAGADWLLADAIAAALPEMERHGCERIHSLAWRCVQGPLRASLANPAGVATGDEGEIRKLSEGLIMSAFAMQASGTSRPASGTEHQVSHYWDMEDLCFDGKPVSHGFKVGIGTLVSTATIEFLLEQDLTALDVEAAVAKWPKTFDELAATFPSVYGNRPDHIRRATDEMAKKYSTPDELRRELTFVKSAWPEISKKMREQILPFAEVRSMLKAAGAPYEPEMIGVSRAKLRETYRGVPYMRARYFSLDLVARLGLMDALQERLFGPAGIWMIKNRQMSAKDFAIIQ